MFMNGMNRVASLLLALGLVLGLVVTGCSDKERDNYKGKDTVKSFSYAFDVEAVGPKTLVVPVNDKVKIAAFATDGERVDAGVKLATDVVKEMQNEDGTYSAKIEVPSTVTDIVLSFYHEDAVGNKLSDKRCWIEGVNDIKDGEAITAEDQDVVAFSIKCMNESGAEQYNYVLGDKFTVSVWDQDNFELTDYVDVVTEPDKLQSDEAAEDLVYTAIGTGVAEFGVEFDGIIEEGVGEVEIALPALVSLQICPQGWQVIGGKVCDENGNPGGMIEFPAIPDGGRYTFFVAGADADGISYKVTPNDAAMTSEPGCVSIDGFTITADKAESGQEEITVKLNDGSLEDTVMVEINPEL